MEQSRPSSGSAMGAPATLTMSDVMDLIRENAKWLGLSVLVGLVAALGYYLAAPRVFESHSSVLVQPVVAERFSDLDLNKVINMPTEMEVAQSSAVAEQAAQKLKITPEQVRSALMVDSPQETQIINIRFRASTAGGAAAGAQVVAESYVAYREANATADVDRRVQALDQQIQQTQAKISAAKSDSGYRDYLQRLFDERRSLEEIKATSGGKIISNAAEPSSPAAPRAIPSLVIGIIGGLLLGLLVMMARSGDYRTRARMSQARSQSAGAGSEPRPAMGAAPEPVAEPQPMMEPAQQAPAAQPVLPHQEMPENAEIAPAPQPQMVAQPEQEAQVDEKPRRRLFSFGRNKKDDIDEFDAEEDYDQPMFASAQQQHYEQAQPDNLQAEEQYGEEPQQVNAMAAPGFPAPGQLDPSQGEQPLPPAPQTGQLNVQELAATPMPQPGTFVPAQQAGEQPQAMPAAPGAAMPPAGYVDPTTGAMAQPMPMAPEQQVAYPMQPGTPMQPAQPYAPGNFAPPQGMPEAMPLSAQPYPAEQPFDPAAGQPGQPMQPMPTPASGMPDPTMTPGAGMPQHDEPGQPMHAEVPAEPDQGGGFSAAPVATSVLPARGKRKGGAAHPQAAPQPEMGAASDEEAEQPQRRGWLKH